MAETEQKTVVSEYVPPGRRTEDALAEAFRAEGIAPADRQEISQESGTPAASVPEVKAAPPTADEEPRLLKIAREKAAKRQQEQASKPQNDLLSAFTPQEIERITQARRSGDPVSALRALGFDHTQYTKAVLNMKDEETPKEQPQVSPDVASLKAEVERLRSEREQEKLQSSRQQMLGQMKTLLGSNPKFDHINKLEDYEGVEKELIAYYSQYGELPGANLEESVSLAAELYESKLKKEAARWSKVLTGFKEGAPIAPSKAPESPPSPGTEATRTLTNSNTTAPAAVTSVSKSRAERLQAMLEGREVE